MLYRYPLLNCSRVCTVVRVATRRERESWSQFELLAVEGVGVLCFVRPCTVRRYCRCTCSLNIGRVAVGAKVTRNSDHSSSECYDSDSTYSLCHLFHSSIFWQKKRDGANYDESYYYYLGDSSPANSVLYHIASARTTSYSSTVPF